MVTPTYITLGSRGLVGEIEALRRRIIFKAREWEGSQEEYDAWVLEHTRDVLGHMRESVELVPGRPFLEIHEEY